MRIGIVGCGYVADYYMVTAPGHPELDVVAVTDLDVERARKFAAHHEISTVYPALDDLLGDGSIEIVLNLTNPHSHYGVTKHSLEAGKHVYTEKPLAMDLEHARELVELASARDLQISSAPCNVLGEAAQTAWQAIRRGAIGRPYTAYAEMDDGMIHRTRYREWISGPGAPWPWRDEFEVGCTMEHAGYYLSWLAAFFGPARIITSFAQNVVADKRTDLPLRAMTPDFSVGTMAFDHGVVARLTCSIIAPHDRSLQIVGEEGVLTVEDCWDYETSVHVQPTPIGRRYEEWPMVSRLLRVAPRKLPLVRTSGLDKDERLMDYFRGVSDMARAIETGRSPRLSPEFSLHITELALAMQYPDQLGRHRELTSTFEPMPPMDWAR